MDKISSNLITIGVLPGWQAYTGALDTFLDNVFRGIQAAGIEFNANLLFGCGIGQGYGLGLGQTALPIHTDGVDYVPIGPWNCDGLIVIPPMASDAGLSYFQGLYDSGFPLVFAGSAPIGSGVIADNEGGIRLALIHLLQHGHRQIAFISGREHDVDSDSVARKKAYLDFLDEFGLVYEPALIAPGYHTYHGGADAMKMIMARKKGFTAVLASNDQSATGAMDALREQGFLIPNDVAVVGFDNRTESKTQIPLLTTVRFPMFELGYQAVNQLVRWINNNERCEKLTRIPTHLVIRESCGCAPGTIIRDTKTLVKKSTDAPIDIVIQSVEDIQKAIADIAFTETQYMGYQEVSYLCVRLFEALMVSIQHYDPAPFYDTLQQILDYASTQDEDLYAWQKVISFLWKHQHELQTVLKMEDTQNQIQRLIDLARLEISEVTRGHVARMQLQSELFANHLGQMTTQFLSAKEEGQILTAIQSILPAIGIQDTTIGIYETDGKNLTAFSNLYSSSKENQPTNTQIVKKILTRDFPLIGQGESDRRFSLVVLPLKIQEDLLGFVAFETQFFGSASLIARQIAAAWRSVHLFREVTEARGLAEERRISAEEANHIKSRLLSIVSHELRTPLNLIAGLTDVLLRESVNDKDYLHIARQDMERISISAQHLDGLIRDVLDLARLDIGQLKLTCEQLEIKEILHSANIIGKQLAEDKNLIWKYEVPSDLPLVWGDRTRLRQVILNLINNAVKFTAQGEVTLSACEREGKIIISVRDTGLGIPIYEQQFIFEEFRQSDRSTARGFGGLGLGLAICKKLVEMHGGEIGVFSDGIEGNGSTFSFSLPVKDTVLGVNPLLAKPPYSDHIQLLVSDMDSGSLLQQYLIQKGYRVDLNLIQGNSNWFANISNLAPDVILMDLGIASDQGWDVLQTLKNNPSTKDISVLFFTLKEKEGFGSILDLDFVTKPLTVNSLSGVLDKSGFLENTPEQESKAILIVDDDPGIIELHARLINHLSPQHQILRALNGNQALQIIRNRTIDLVILDLLMPELDGFSVLQTMRSEEISRNIPVIVVTSQTLSEEDIKRLNLGVIAVLNKGIYTVQETLEHIANALQHKKISGSDIQQRVLRALTFIHQNFSEPISRSLIASHVGLSERHLNRCFQQELGVSPIVYLNRYRIKQAKTMLEAGNKDITSIAFDVGFTSSGYFTRVFREEVGVSPRNFLRFRSQSNSQGSY